MQMSYTEAIKTCHKAIDLSSKTNNYKRIILLYYLLGISKFKFNKKSYKEDIEKSLILCDLLKKPDLKIIINQSVSSILAED